MDKLGVNEYHNGIINISAVAQVLGFHIKWLGIKSLQSIFFLFTNLNFLYSVVAHAKKFHGMFYGIIMGSFCFQNNVTSHKINRK